MRKELLSIFPSIESYNSFKGDVNEIEKKSIFNYFCIKRVINESDRDSNKLVFDIINNNINEYQSKINENERIEPDFAKLKNKVNIEKNAELVREVNSFKEKFNIEITKISYSMFSLFKKEKPNTRGRRNALRLIALWISDKYPDLITQWNYETLLQCCNREKKSINLDEGVRMVFSLHGQGGLIDDKMLSNFEKEINQSLKYLKKEYLSLDKGKPFKITEFSINLPKQRIEEKGLNNPESYRRYVYDAIAIAHQVLIRWEFSEYYKDRIMSIISIAAGQLSSQDIYLQNMIKIQSNCAIRMTNFTYQCVLANKIKLTFCNKPKEVQIFNDEIFKIWFVEGLWNTKYLDFVDVIMKLEALQTNEKSQKQLQEILLNNSLLIDEKTDIIKDLKSFRNTLVGLEIAKVLFYRRIFWAVNIIIEKILNANPYDISARIFRMMNFIGMGVSSPYYTVSKIQFDRSNEEANYILQNYKNLDEDFYCEYALGKLFHAIIILRKIRKNRGVYSYNNKTMDSKNVLELLSESESIFKKSFTIPATGWRSFYWLLRLQSLKRILENNDNYLTKDVPIIDKNNICRHVAMDYYLALNWINIKDIEAKNFDELEKNLLNIINMYISSVSLRTYKLNVLFSVATLLWDFFPVINVSIATKVLQFLDDAREIAKKNESNNDNINTFSIIGAELIPTNDFKCQVEKSINEIEDRVGKLESLEKQNEKSILDKNDIGKLKLFLMYI